ncbi:MAG: pyridoxamine 5'-phosphate oxidase family protein [Candidatus Methylomirabilia bacterium]
MVTRVGASMREGLREEIVQYIKSHHVMTLATTAHGRPWAAAVFYASKDLTLLFVSEPDSRHCMDLRECRTVSAAIHENYENWREIRGLQLEGTAEPVPTRELASALAVYLAKFPFVKEFLTPQGLFRVAGRTLGARFYRLSPFRLLLLDNRKAFGHREELVVDYEGS